MVTPSAAGKEAETAKEPPKKKEKEKKTKEAPIKPWDMSLEECDRITQESIRALQAEAGARESDKSNRFEIF